MFQDTHTIPSGYRVLSQFALYRYVDRSLHLGWNAGFFSNNTVILWAICDLLRDRLPIDSIQFRFCFSAYRSPEQSLYQYDLYPDYFTQDSAIRLPDRPIARSVHQHGLYYDLDFDWLNPVLQRYFSPALGIRQLVTALKAKYHFDGRRTIGVCYRGTDKGSEVRLAQPREYLKLTQRLLKRHSDCRVLIQTDQEQVRDLFLRELPEQSWFIEEMPVTSGSTSLADVSDCDRGVDRYEFGRRILATALLLAECDYLVDHTGNMGLWLALFRGHHDNLYQFGATGHLSTPLRRRLSRWRRALPDILAQCRDPVDLLSRLGFSSVP
jgi:hypothetical protein